MPRLRGWLAYWHGIQARFVLMLVVFVVVSMTLLGMAVYTNQRRVILERVEQDTRDLTQDLLNKGNATATFLTRLVPSAMLSYDFLLLGTYVEEMSADTDIVYIVILNATGTPITHYLKPDNTYFLARGLRINPESYPFLLESVRHDQSLLIIQRSIDYDMAALGTVEVGLSREKILQRTAELRADLRRELRHTALFTGGAILLSLVALILLIQRVFSRMVVQPLKSLGEQMARLQAGDLQARAPILREDEIGRLARSFNHMASDLQAQLIKIEEQRGAYKETRDYLANILDHSEDMIATTALDGCIVQFNPAAERILGYTHAEIAGLPSALLYSETAEHGRLYAAVRNGRAVQNADISLRRKDSSAVDMELTLSPLRDNTGNLVGAVCIGRDVTQARALQRALIEAEKMVSIGQVSAWIAHQVRNSLSSIQMAASSLLSGGIAGAPRDNLLRGLTGSIAKLDHMVTDLLDYSRTLQLHMTPVNLRAILDDQLGALTARDQNPCLHVERVFSPDLPKITADVFKLEHAFSNVLKNAVQAMPGGGKLRLEATPGPGACDVTVIIADSGVGIAGAHLAQVFLPFFSTKSGGTGLGLAMTARIIEAHGGSVRVESNLGSGTKFTIVLPVSAAKESQA
jgi:PAS domain S-box-containing protein